MSDHNGRQLPAGWDVAPLCDIANVVMGQSPPSETYNRVGDGLPFFQGKAEFTNLYPEVRSWCNAPGKIAKKNNILLSIRAPVGPTNLASDTCCIGRGLAAIQPVDGIDHRFLLYAFRAFSNRLTTQATGTTFRAVSGKQVREFSVPISPTNEQHRIVDKIEELFSDFDAGVAALERVRRNLKRYRASVLKAAVEGRLTEAWRAEHPDVEPAAELLARILKERRRRWAADQLAVYAAKGRKPPKGWKEKYKEPTPLDDSALPSLPRSWAWASLDELLRLGNYGTSVKCTYEADGVPVLRIPNISRSEIDLADLKFATTEIAGDFLDTGDILTCRTNGSIDLIGKAAVIRTPFPTPHHFASYLIRLRLAPKQAYFENS